MGGTFEDGSSLDGQSFAAKGAHDALLITMEKKPGASWRRRLLGGLGREPVLGINHGRPVVVGSFSKELSSGMASLQATGSSDGFVCLGLPALVP